MKTLYRHAFKLFTAFLLAFSLQSCVTNPGTWKNEQISSGKRADFHKLNNQLLKDLKVDDDKDLGFIESREMTENVSTLRLVETLSNSVKQHDYELLDEYYAVNHFIGNDTIKNPVKGINTYHLVYGGLTHEMYFAFFAPKNKHLLNQDLITAVYAKYDYGWKISSLSINPYIINRKTAPEFYRMAQDKYRNGRIVDALYTLDLATQCGTPSEVWQYTNLEGMSNLYGKVTNEANNLYKFPIMVKSVNGQPKIFRIFNQKTENGTFPMIYYLTNIKLKDTTAVKNENMQMRKVIDNVFPGIDKDKKYVLYSAFNERPLGIKTVAHFDMSDKLQ